MAWESKILFLFYEVQKRIKARDIDKNQIAVAHGYTLLRFWEDEIKNDFENVKTHYQCTASYNVTGNGKRECLKIAVG